MFHSHTEHILNVTLPLVFFKSDELAFVFEKTNFLNLHFS